MARDPSHRADFLSQILSQIASQLSQVCDNVSQVFSLSQPICDRFCDRFNNPRSRSSSPGNRPFSPLPEHPPGGGIPSLPRAAPQARSVPYGRRNRHQLPRLTRHEQSALRQWTYSLLVGMPGAERRACPTRARSGAAGAPMRGPRSPRSNHEISTEKRPRLTRGKNRYREWHEFRPSFDRLLTEVSPRLKTPPEK